MRRQCFACVMAKWEGEYSSEETTNFGEPTG